jgi:hypothetical protein
MIGTGPRGKTPLIAEDWGNLATLSGLSGVDCVSLALRDSPQCRQTPALRSDLLRDEVKGRGEGREAR